jgi:hypothetical protein
MSIIKKRPNIGVSLSRRMLDSHYHPDARINTGVIEYKNAFYAIYLRHVK